jgi:hypothetical protein
MGGAARPDHAVASNPSSSRQRAVGLGAPLHEVVENAKVQLKSGDWAIDRGAAEAAPEVGELSQAGVHDPVRNSNYNVREYL